MAKIESFEDLKVWNDAVDIAVKTYRVCEKNFAKEYSIKDQIIRSSFSISNNIAEGFEYNNSKDFVRYLRYSKGSVGELRNQFIILKKIGLLPENDFDILYQETKMLSKQLKGFMQYLKNRKTDTVQEPEENYYTSKENHEN